MTTCSPGLTPESSTVCPSTESPPDPPSVTSRISYTPPVATKMRVLSPIMAIAPEGTLTAARKRVVLGKRGPVRVDLGGGRIFKHKLDCKSRHHRTLYL